MAKTLGFVAALAGVALLGWLLLRPGGAPRGARGAEATAAERTEAAAPELAPAPVATEAARQAGPVVTAREDGADVPAAQAPRPAPDLRVAVRDEQGQPLAGLEVLAGIQRSAGPDREWISAHTDAQGLAAFHDLRPREAALAGGLLRVSLAGLFVPAIALERPVEPWPEEPLELVVPRAGAVEVRVLEASGEPHRAENRVLELRLERELAPGAMVWRESARLVAPLEDGVARFAPVGLGLRLSARLAGRDEVEPAALELDGPRDPGELVRAELRLAPPAPLVTLRVLTPERAPLASSELSVALLRRAVGGAIQEGEQRTTDAEGRLSVPVRGSRSEGETRTLILTHQPGAGPEARGSVELPRELASGTHDLGDVVLAARPLLVSGRVIDAQGRGIQEAVVALESRTEYGESSYWDSFAWCEVQEDGSFASYVEAPADEPLRLAVNSTAHEPFEALEFTPGTAGLEIVLRRGLSLRGSVRVPEGMSPLAIGVLARGAREIDRREIGVEASGTFELTGLPPGTCDVEFLLRPTAESVLVVPGVRVAEGESDPRLVDVDLTQLVRRVRLGVRAADGSPASGGWARLLRADDAQQVAFVIEAGVAELLLPAAGADVEVSVPGHRLLEVLGLVGDREVTLASSFRVQCELAPHVVLPPGGELQLRLMPVNATRTHCMLFRAHEQAGWFSSAFGSAQNSFDERRVIEVEIQSPGEHEVVFHLVHGRASGGRMSISLNAGGPNTRLVLDESSAGKTFLVEPDAEAYARRLGDG